MLVSSYFYFIFNQNSCFTSFYILIKKPIIISLLISFMPTHDSFMIFSVTLMKFWVRLGVIREFGIKEGKLIYLWRQIG